MTDERTVLAKFTGFAADADGQLDRQQTKERGELDHRIHGHRRSVLERIADGIADDRGVMQGRAFLFQFNFDDLLCVVPGAAGVGHENRLIQAEQRDRDQVADEEELVEEGEPEGGEEDRQEDVEHPRLGVLGADLDHLLAVGGAGLLGRLQVDVRLDELDGPVRPGGDRLGARPGEPVDHRPAGDQAEQERRVQDRQVLQQVGLQAVRQGHDDGEDHRRRADDGRADQHRLGRRLERVAG